VTHIFYVRGVGVREATKTTLRLLGARIQKVVRRAIGRRDLCTLVANINITENSDYAQLQRLMRPVAD